MLQAIAKLAGGEEGSELLDSTEDEPFNAVKKLKADAERESQERAGINLKEHILVNRTATFALKSMIAPRRREGEESIAGSTELANAIAEEVAPHVGYWLRRCAQDPTRTSGTAYVFVGLLEAGAGEAQTRILDAIRTEPGLLEEVRSKSEAKLAETRTAAESGDGAGQGKGGKRKRKGGKAGSTEGEDGRERTIGIQTLLNAVEASTA